MGEIREENREENQEEKRLDVRGCSTCVCPSLSVQDVCVWFRLLVVEASMTSWSDYCASLKSSVNVDGAAVYFTNGTVGSEDNFSVSLPFFSFSDTHLHTCALAFVCVHVGSFPTSMFLCPCSCSIPCFGCVLAGGSWVLIDVVWLYSPSFLQSTPRELFTARCSGIIFVFL